jgi:HlyD family secretion protein
VGANPEPKSDSAAEPTEQVRWISREGTPRERITVMEDPSLDAGDTGRRETRTKWISAAALVAIAIAAGVYWKIRTGTPSTASLASRESAPLVTVVAPTLKPVTTAVAFTGTIAARYDMPIGIDGDAGRIVAVNVEAGDHVKKGQVLAELDESVLRPQVNRLAASLDQARAQAALSAAEYRRAKGVEAAGALSAEDIEKRRAAAITDDASVKVAAAMLAEAQARLARTRVVAPANGTVLTRKAEVGQIASPGGDALFRLASGGEIEMRGQVAEQDLAALKVGQPASVYLTGLPQAFEGRVRLLGAVIDTQSRLGDIRVSLKPDPTLRPGAFARGAVTTAKVERPILPQTAVLSDDEGTYVFVVSEDNKVQRRAVHISGTTPDGVIISSGLTGNERIVATAGGFLREGETVSIAASTTPDAGTPRDVSATPQTATPRDAGATPQTATPRDAGATPQTATQRDAGATPQTATPPAAATAPKTTPQS